MPVYRIDIGDHTYRVESDRELSDQQAYDAARSSPAAVQDQNEVMRANMAKQAGAGEASSPWSPSAIGKRAVEGLKGEAEGFGVGLIGAATLPFAVAHAGYQAVRHPLETAQSAIKGMYVLGNMADTALSNPRDTLNTVTDVASKVGSDPRMIGRIAGGIGAGIAAGTARGVLRRALPMAEESGVLTGVRSTAETPLELTRRLATENRAKYGGLDAAKELAFPSASTAVSAAPTVVQPIAEAAAKPAFTARDVVRIKLLMQQGLSQDAAVQLVKDSVLAKFIGQ